MQDHEGVPSSHQRIYLATIELKDGKVLSDYDIGNNATLEMKLQLNART
ncbi:ubiquitin-like protein [Pseudomonas weihenstephanensis]